MTETLRELVSAWVASRDQDAARRLVEALHPQITRIVQNHIPRGMDAEDLAQEVFVQFFRTLERYDPTRPLENWVSRLALNVCLKALRTRARRPEWRWADLSETEQAVVASLFHETEADSSQAQDARELLAKLLDALSPQERMILTLLHLEEKSVEEIATATGWNATLVKVRAFRARAKMKKALKTLAEEKL
ncbi:MAG: sigma-70 family RNA polymerase sigma factor [Verrucomicrobiota bacterium]